MASRDVQTARPIFNEIRLPALDSLTSAPSQVRPPHRDAINTKLLLAESKLSPLAKSLLELPEMERLKGVFNTAMIYTKIFNHIDISRYEHSVHAASQTHDLKLPLTEHEKAVLELALLFHDLGHVLGSHAMDRVFAVLRGAPPIGEWGYDKEDYHELHGAQLLGQGKSSAFVRETLGPKIFGDLLAVLTFADERPQNQKVDTYGHFAPTLPQEKLKRLYTLKDVLDRTSYLELDYSSAGYQNEIVKGALRRVNSYRESIILTEDGVGAKHVPSKGGSELDQTYDPYEQVIWARRKHYEEVPGHPTNGLVAVLLQHAVWNQVKLLDPNLVSAQSGDVYTHVRDQVINGEYSRILGADMCKWLFEGPDCLTDLVAPVVTLKKSDFTDRGRLALERIRTIPGQSNSEDFFPSNLISSTCGAPIYDVTSLELRMKQAAQEQGISLPIYFIISHELDKDFTYHVATQESPESLERRRYRAKNRDKDVGHVIIAAKAIDEQGRLVDLSRLQTVLEQVLIKSGWVNEPSQIRANYNPRVFVEPYRLEVFSASIQDKMLNLNPKWMKLGGAGLLDGVRPPSDELH